MPSDANVALQASVTKTATFNGTALDLKLVQEAFNKPLFVRVLFSAATNASGSNSVTFQVDYSDDNSTFFNEYNDAYDIVNLSTTAQQGEIYIPLQFARRYLRLTATFAGAGSTPTITYQGDIVMSRP